MDARLNIFTQTRQVEFIPVSLCHRHFIECRHFCLSLARPNDMKIIIVQESHGLSWNLQTFYSTEEDKVKWALISSTVIHMRATQHFHCGLLLGTTRIKEKNFRETHWNIFGVFVFLLQQVNNKKKWEKLFTRESSQQAKEEQGNLFGFSF